MSELKFVEYNDDIHREQFYILNFEYLSWANNLIYQNRGIHLIPDGNIDIYLKDAFPVFTSIKPPKGIIYVLEADSQVVGMGVLKKLEDNVGEIKRMYIRPQYRGGLGTLLYGLLEDKAREYGFTTLRLDTSMYMEAAVHLYKKFGFKEIEGYSGGEWPEDHPLIVQALFMEKKL